MYPENFSQYSISRSRFPRIGAAPETSGDFFPRALALADTSWPPTSQDGGDDGAGTQCMGDQGDTPEARRRACASFRRISGLGGDVDWARAEVFLRGLSLSRLGAISCPLWKACTREARGFDSDFAPIRSTKGWGIISGDTALLWDACSPACCPCFCREATSLLTRSASISAAVLCATRVAG